MTYFDHAATTPIRPDVVETMSQVMLEVMGNPSSIHQYGRKAHEYLENARQIIADSLHVAPHEIIFTSGGTEGDNTAIIGTALSRQSEGQHIITTAVEHPAVLQSMRYLETLGFEITYLPVNKQGQLTVDDVAAALREDTILVSIMFANNETGNIFPIQEIGELLQDHPAYFHTDAVQVYGKLPINAHELQVDLMTTSGHKINGPKGIGVIYKRDAVRLPAYLHGGEQEEKRRAGTENLAAICGMAKAIQILSEEEQSKNQQRYQMFKTYLLETLTTHQVDFHINGDPTNQLPHLINLQFVGVPSDLLLMHLDLKGFAVSTGSACTAGNVEPSHVLEAMYGKNAQAVKESIRISFGYGNTFSEVEAFVEVLLATIERLKR
uniref:cysteine desulfurase family protein n=1 Tax=Candidatus Enterococcus willemsii TaxID=1857215 RepID=UPI00403F6832